LGADQEVGGSVTPLGHARFTSPRITQRIVPPSVEVDGILVPAGDPQNTGLHHLERRVPDAVRIAAIRHCFGEPQANTMFALRLPQKQHAAIRRLIAAGQIVPGQ
jgi:hypothetical protein